MSVLIFECLTICTEKQDKHWARFFFAFKHSNLFLLHYRNVYTYIQISKRQTDTFMYASLSDHHLNIKSHCTILFLLNFTQKERCQVLNAIPCWRINTQVYVKYHFKRLDGIKAQLLTLRLVHYGGHEIYEMDMTPFSTL